MGRCVNLSSARSASRWDVEGTRLEVPARGKFSSPVAASGPAVNRGTAERIPGHGGVRNSEGFSKKGSTLERQAPGKGISKLGAMVDL
jgi:hypothetical protein